MAGWSEDGDGLGVGYEKYSDEKDSVGADDFGLSDSAVQHSGGGAVANGWCGAVKHYGDGLCGPCGIDDAALNKMEFVECGGTANGLCGSVDGLCGIVGANGICGTVMMAGMRAGCPLMPMPT